MIQSNKQVIRFEAEGSGVDFNNWHIPGENIDSKIEMGSRSLFVHHPSPDFLVFW